MLSRLGVLQVGLNLPYKHANLTFKAMKSTVQNLSLKKLSVHEDLCQVVKLVDDVRVKENIFIPMASLDPAELRHFYIFRSKVALTHDVSFGFYEKPSGKLVAMMLNSVYCKDSKNSLSSNYQYDYDLSNFTYSNEILTFIRFLRWFVKDLFDELNTDCYVDLGMIAVDPKFRRLGLSEKLAIHSEIVARNQGVSCATSFSTTAASCGLMNKLGYSLLRKASYEGYVDGESEKKIFEKVVPPSTHCYMFYKHFRT